jgi:hypothetical protein
MAITLTSPLTARRIFNGVTTFDSVKVLDASEENLTTPNVANEWESRALSKVTLYLKFANYTSVSVKLQQSLDGVTWWDVGAALTANNTRSSFSPDAAPRMRLSAAGTLSAGADTMEVWVYAEAHPGAIW